MDLPEHVEEASRDQCAKYWGNSPQMEQLGVQGRLLLHALSRLREASLWEEGYFQWKFGQVRHMSNDSTPIDCRQPGAVLDLGSAYHQDHVARHGALLSMSHMEVPVTGPAGDLHGQCSWGSAISGDHVRWALDQLQCRLIRLAPEQLVDYEEPCPSPWVKVYHIVWPLCRGDPLSWACSESPGVPLLLFCSKCLELHFNGM